MPKIYKRNCNYCGEYYENKNKYFCNKKCEGLSRRGKPSGMLNKQQTEKWFQIMKGRMKGENNPLS